MRYRVHIEMSRDGYPLRLQTDLLVGGSSQSVAKARALELAREQHPECDDFRVYHVEELGKCKKTVDMPTMNEEIAINGSYLYVNFESVSFSIISELLINVSEYSYLAPFLSIKISYF